MRLWLLLGVLASFIGRDVFACAICSAGDPTLTSIGVERLFQGRLRASSIVEFRNYSQGVNAVDRQSVDEIRTDLGLSYVPHRRWAFTLMLPVVHKKLTTVSERTQSATGLGDLWLAARFVLWQQDNRSSSHIVSFSGGLRFPTGPELKLPNGHVAPHEIQPGTGTWTPTLGLQYAYFRGKLSMFTTLRSDFPVHSKYDERDGLGMFATTMGQFQPWTWIALQASADFRYVTSAVDYAGNIPNSGGIALFLGPGVALMPITDFFVRFMVRAPVWSAYNGTQSESVVYHISMAYDWAL